MSEGVLTQLVGRVAQLRALLEEELRERNGRLLALVRHGARYARLRRALLHHRAVFSLMLARRHGVLDTLAHGALEPRELAERTGLQPEAARTLLAVLESQGLVEREGPRRALTSFARAALLDDGPITLGPLVGLLATFSSAFDELSSSLISGVPSPSLNVLDDDGQSEAFLQAVNAWLFAAGTELLARARLPEVRHFIVGSMGVSMSAMLLDRFPNARVTYGCLEHLVRRIPSLRARYGVDPERVDGMHVHGGEPEEDQWGHESFDLVFLTKKMLLTPERRLGERFARKAFEVLRPKGALILWEAIHDDGRSTTLPLAMETVLDLGVSPAGPLLTRQGVREMLMRIGFEDVELFTCMGGETTFAIARRP